MYTSSHMCYGSCMLLLHCYAIVICIKREIKVFKKLFFNYFFFNFETWSCFVSQAGLNLEAIFLFQLPKCQGYRCLSPGPSLCVGWASLCHEHATVGTYGGVWRSAGNLGGQSSSFILFDTGSLCAPLHKPGQPSRVFRNATVPSSCPPQEGMQGLQMPTVISFTQIWRSECRPSCSQPSPWSECIVFKQYLSGLTQVVIW